MYDLVRANRVTVIIIPGSNPAGVNFSTFPTF